MFREAGMSGASRWGSPAASSRVRTSDSEREQVAAILRAAVAEGRLTLQEGDERLAKTYEAVYRDELSPLTADLPHGGWAALARTPEALAQARRGLRRHAAFVALGSGLLVGLWMLSGSAFFWPVIPILVLTFSLVRRARWARYGAPWGRGPWGPNRGWGWGPR
jgi:hypothetical protein